MRGILKLIGKKSTALFDIPLINFNSTYFALSCSTKLCIAVQVTVKGAEAVYLCLRV